MPVPAPTCLVVKMTHAALNHRDLFIRQQLYPNIAFETPLLSDGCGLVVGAGSTELEQRWLNKRIVLNPGRGWHSAPEGPEEEYRILGGTKGCSLGTLQEYLAVEASEVEEAPEHLSSVEAAGLPLAGLTAWRAVVTKSGNAERGRNILITGIGGGVALMALQFAKARGCNVFVTSGDDNKLKTALAMGARGGVNYKSERWEKELKEKLPKDKGWFDAIIDGAGGNVVEKGIKLLKVS